MDTKLNKLILQVPEKLYNITNYEEINTLY